MSRGAGWRPPTDLSFAGLACEAAASSRWRRPRQRRTPLRLPRLAGPELVHVAEGLGMGRLEGFPGGEVDRPGVVGIGLAVGGEDRSVDVEAEQLQSVLLQHPPQVGEPQLVLL